MLGPAQPEPRLQQDKGANKQASSNRRQFHEPCDTSRATSGTSQAPAETRSSGVVVVVVVVVVVSPLGGGGVGGGWEGGVGGWGGEGWGGGGVVGWGGSVQAASNSCQRMSLEKSIG